MPALHLTLDKEDYGAGAAFTGVLHSRFARARVLLTLRDSTGIRLVKPLQIEGTRLALAERLPADLHYGCSVEVQYIERNDQTFIVSKFIRVAPVERMLTIKTSTRETIWPG